MRQRYYERQKWRSDNNIAGNSKKSDVSITILEKFTIIFSIRMHQ